MKPKEFVEKIKNSEDPSIMSKFVFEKCEMTFHYADYVMGVFEGYGLQVYNLPIFEFQK